MVNKRLLWQLFPSYVLIAIVSVFAVTWFANRSTREFYFAKTARDLESRARLVTYQVAPLIEAGNRHGIADLCTVLGRQSGTRITIIDADGVVLGDSHEDPARMENHAGRPEVVDALNLRVGVETRFSQTLKKRMMYVAVPMAEGVKPQAVVRTALTVGAIDDAIGAVYARITFGAIVIIIIAAGLSLFISRRIARPLEKLQRGAERIASGDLSTRLMIGEANEIGSLAHTMNRMRERLDERFQTIVTQKHQEEAVLASMVESVIAVDAEGRLITANAAAVKLLDLDLEGKQGQRLQDIVRHHQLLELVERTIAGAEPIEDEIRLYDPEERFLQVHGTALRDPVGDRIGGLLVLNDITQLRRLERIRRDFVANVSHELKTPITAIKGFVETLLGGALENAADADRFLRLVAKHTERLNSIIEDLLSLSRIESQQEDITVERMKIVNVLRQAIDACRVAAQKGKVSVVLTGDETLECVLNSTLIEQAVVNLVDNAIKYSEGGGRVDVRTERTEDGSVAIHVEDRGCGIEPEHLPRLFERFYRSDKARSRAIGGTGLGLAIVKHIALAHGGTVDVRSRVGEGSTFSIFLPLETQWARR